MTESDKQQQKLAALGMLSAGIAHEIQNPLNFVINFSKMSDKLLQDLKDIILDVADDLNPDDVAEIQDIADDLTVNMQKIREHGERAISIIQGILLISRGKDNEFVPSDLRKIVKEYIWLSYHAMRAKNKGFNVSIHENYQDDMKPVTVIPQDISRAVLNLASNAFYAIWNKAQTKPDYKPELSVSVSADDEQVRIVITDNGEGMSELVKMRLYENFFTTKPIGKGTGLGMGITRDIVENKHGGKLTFESTEGEGTSFTITIPIRK